MRRRGGYHNGRLTGVNARESSASLRALILRRTNSLTSVARVNVRRKSRAGVRTRLMNARLTMKYETLIYKRARSARAAVFARKEGGREGAVSCLSRKRPRDTYLHVISAVCAGNFHFYRADKFQPAFNRAAIYRVTRRINIRTTK